jgi:Ti-type conjugative transfer relaxase TraA
MAIGYARFEFVKRSEGKNACAKSAYIAREKVLFLGTKYSEKRTYNFSSHGEVFHKDILLPTGASKEFLNPEVLWNHVEQMELRGDSQVAFELVLALPDDSEVSGKDRVEITEKFSEKFLVSEGLSIQYAIHSPEKNGKNWHAHILSTTRQFNKDGTSLSNKKDRELIQNLAKTNWGKEFAEFQNNYFSDKDIDLRVDPNGVVSQIHLGPKRMVKRAFSLFQEQDQKLQENKELSKDSSWVLSALTDKKSVFCERDFDRYLEKFVDESLHKDLRNSFWKHSELVKLYDRESGSETGFFTTKGVLIEQRKLERISSKMKERKSISLNSTSSKEVKEYSSLTNEQKRVFSNVVSDGDLSLIQGYAGTGKSYLLKALESAYLKSGYKVRSFGPDNATVKVLEEKGLRSVSTVHGFLFSLHHGFKSVSRNKEVWLVDEATKLGSDAFSEFLTVAGRSQVKLVLSGDELQIPSISRGRVFKDFGATYGLKTLSDIQRQEGEIEREIALHFSKGEVSLALEKMERSGGIRWLPTLEASMESLVKEWGIDRVTKPNDSQKIVVSSNKELAVINELCRGVKRTLGEIKGQEICCETAGFGKVFLSKGDLIEFRENNKELGVRKGDLAQVSSVSESNIEGILCNEKERFCFNPKEFGGFHLGYAKTYYRVQGDTVDRSYVLFAPQIDKEQMYVGMTRSRKSTTLFVSKEHAENSEDLSFKLQKEKGVDGFSESLLSKEELNIEQKKERISDLMQGTFTSKVKATGLSLLNGISEKVSSYRKGLEDAKSSDSFYSFHQESMKTKAFEVWEIKDGETQVKDQLPYIEKPEVIPLSLDENKLLSSYLESREKEKALYASCKVGAINLERDISETESFKDWQRSCGKRNESAFHLTTSIDKEKLLTVLDKEVVDSAFQQSERYRDTQDKFEEKSFSSVEMKVRENIDLVLENLFETDPVVRKGSSVRYGNNGSLCIDLRPGREGNFFDFEKDIGGGPIQLIQKELDLNPVEAKSRALDILGERVKISPKQSVPKGYLVEERSWVSDTPPKGEKVPTLKDIGKEGLLKHNVETARYEYRNLEGDLLFVNCRLENKETGKKLFQPLSYGAFSGEGNQQYWNTKGFKEEKRSLYNLPELKEKPEATVLLVEGEKAVDAAKKIYDSPYVVCMTWQGGASSVEKADWSPLEGRDVIIWPDNDKSGFEASEKVVKEIRKVGAGDIYSVGKEYLSKFPKKWDLADECPSEVSLPETCGKLELVADLKSHSPTCVESTISFVEGFDGKSERELDFVSKEISWRVQERLTGLSQNLEVLKQDLKQEAKVICEKSQELVSQFSKENGVSFEKQERLTTHVAICYAETGECPGKEKLVEILSQIEKLEELLPRHSFGEESSSKEIAFDRTMLSFSCVGERDLGSTFEKHHENEQQKLDLEERTRDEDTSKGLSF